MPRQSDKQVLKITSYISSCKLTLLIHPRKHPVN